MYRFVSSLIICFLILLHGPVSASEPRLIRVGAFNYYPGIFKDKDEKIKGFYVDALDEFGKRENIRFEYVYGSWSEGLERMKSGEVDMLTSVAYTPERAQYMDFPKTPLLTVWGELYAPHGSKIQGIQDVQGKKIAVMAGDYNGRSFIDLVHKFNISCQFIEFPDFEKVFRAVVANEVDAGVVNSTFGTTRKSEYGITSTGIIFNPFDIYFTVGKGKNSDFLALLNNYLLEWRHDENSVYNKSRQKWTHANSIIYVVPTWVKYSAVALAVVMGIAFIFIALLKIQVRHKVEEISEREASLRESSNFITLLLNSTAEAIYGLDTEGNCTFCNAACLTILGYDRQEELLGQNMHALIHHSHADGTPYGLNDCAIYRSFQDGGKTHIDHEVFWKRDGTSFPTEYWSYPIKKGDTNIGSVVTFLDISERKAIEESLRETEMRYRNIFENNHSVMMVVDPEQGDIVDANPTAATYYGWSCETLREMNISDINTLGKEKVRVEMEQVKNRTRHQSSFFQHRLANGVVRDVEVFSGPIRTAGKTLLFSIVRDITERKRIEETYEFLVQAGWLSSKEDFFGALSRFLAKTLNMEHIFIVRIDETAQTARTISVWSDGSPADDLEYSLKNTPCEDVVGKSICVFEKGVCVTFPKDAVLRGLGAESYVGTTLWGFDGQPIGLIAAISSRPLSDPHLAESVLKLVAVRTSGELERKRAEEALLESWERYRTLVEHAPVAVMVNRGNQIVLANDACLRLFGSTNGAQLLGKTPMELFHPSFHSVVKERIQAMLQSGEPAPLLEEKIVRLDGTPVDVEVTAAPFKDKGADAIHVVLRDITQQKHYEKELLDKNAELERFTYTVSHDLKSPLITIQFFAEQISHDLKIEDFRNVQDDCKKITDAATKMTNLLDDLLVLSRIGRMKNPSSRIDIQLLLRDILAQLEGPIKRDHVEVTVHPDLPAIHGDPQRIAEVFQNIIENAIKNMGQQPAPRIEVGVRCDESEQIFFIADNGIGIDPRYHQNIFGLFNKLDTQSEGTGVGLALVNRITEAHGGRVWVESEGAGKGSTFCFTLPGETA